MLFRSAALSGLSMDVAVTAGDHCFNEAVLFTHTSLSGPGILQASNYWKIGKKIEINLLPEIDVYSALLELKQAGGSLAKFLNQYWPKRFTQMWLEVHPLEDIANSSNEALQTYADQVTQWALYPEKTAGYDKAEVTLGGVDTDEVSSKNFEAKKQAGLYFIGEVLDVTGQLGGYNFQWAWASGVACGLDL